MEIDIKNPLAETTTLISLTTKIWSGIKVDRKLRNQLGDEVSATDNTLLHVSKHLVGNQANTYFRRILNRVRNNVYYPNTLAWDDNSTADYGKVQSGWRLCPNSRIDWLLSELSTSKDEFFKEVDAFCIRYPELIERARVTLGDAFNITDYPHVEEVRSKFKFDYEVSLLPDNRDIRTTASSDVANRIATDAKKRERKNIQNILRDFVGGVIEQGEHLAEKLKAYDPKQKQKGGFFKNSSIENFRKNVEMIPSVNKDILGNDKDIAQAHQDLVKVLSQINDIDSLRDEGQLGQEKRQSVSSGLQDALDPIKSGLMDKLGGKDELND